MTAPTVTVDVSGALALLEDAARAAADLSPVFAGPINRSVDSMFERQFASEGAFGGQRWRSLAPVTLQLRQRPGHGRGGILRDTNRLWASLTKLGLGPEAVKRVTPDSLERGTTVPYAGPIHEGYESRWSVRVGRQGQPVPFRRAAPKRIPPREIIPDPVPPEIVATWETLITRFVTDAA